MSDKTSHSPEPWSAVERLDSDGDKYQTIFDASGREVTNTTTHGMDCCDCGAVLAMFDCDIARIVACVNACAGITAEDLHRIRPCMEKFDWV